ncbi:MAG: TetR/AcrR family transcriptional regulator [Candidatus Nucleicultricaceae bacterium]
MSGQETRDKILASARMLFVAHGFTGTSMGKIAKNAGVNHSLLFHHFQNKNALWNAVKLSIVSESKKRDYAIPSITLPFPEFIKQMVLNVTHFYRSNPDIVRMIQWQRLDIEHATEIGITRSSESTLWLEAFEHYQNNKEMKSSIKPIFALTFILSILSSAALDTNALLINKEEQEHYLSFCATSILQILEE